MTSLSLLPILVEPLHRLMESHPWRYATLVVVVVGVAGVVFGIVAERLLAWLGLRTYRQPRL